MMNLFGSTEDMKNKIKYFCGLAVAGTKKKMMSEKKSAGEVCWATVHFLSVESRYNKLYCDTGA